jgi:hypothetical protein
MLGAPPKLWTWMCTHWCPVPASAAWLLWRAVSKAQYPPVDAWRARFLAFDAPDRLLSSDVVKGFLAETCTPQHLLEVIDHLMKERTLLKRDGQHLQEQILAHVDRTGQWKQQRGRQPA